MSFIFISVISSKIKNSLGHKSLKKQQYDNFQLENILLLFSIYTILRIEWLRFPRVPSQPRSSTGTAPSGVSPLILRNNMTQLTLPIETSVRIHQ
ncbi:hypothetical protein CD116_03620, partial [Staphylococcus schweitzeri]